jgi:hypothetical protein
VFCAKQTATCGSMQKIHQQLVLCAISSTVGTSLRHQGMGHAFPGPFSYCKISYLVFHVAYVEISTYTPCSVKHNPTILLTIDLTI